MELCLANPSDRPDTIDLWSRVFGDSHEAVRDFYRAFPNCLTYVARAEIPVAAVVHVMERELVPRGRAAYVYAVATDPAFRGRGLCRSLMAYAEEDLKRRGFDCCVLRPGSESLFRFYAELGYETAFCRSHHTGSGGEIVTAAEYARLREQYLTVPHTVCDETLLNYANSVYGLTFYRTETGCRAASCRHTEECLPEDVGGEPDAMLKWLTEPRFLETAYLGFALE